MSAAKDPFEEFLRKKKVEMLEKQYRPDEPSEASEEQSEAFEDDWSQATPSEEEHEQKLAQEMSEFFDEGGRGGAEIFERAREIDDERVEEIKDALEDVFEEPKGVPEDASDNETFVDFFKQVQTDFDAEAREVVQPPDDEEEPGAFEEDEPQTAEFPLPGEEGAEGDLETDDSILGPPLELEAETARAVDEVVEEIAGSPAPAPTVVIREPEGTGGSDESDDPGDPDDSEVGRDATSLVLSEILTPPQEGEDLRQRVDLLSRLIVKLVERAKIPESELVEVLIKSGVEF
jgi:hypothetical protein